jgi:hypothetical protein
MSFFLSAPGNLLHSNAPAGFSMPPGEKAGSQQRSPIEPGQGEFWKNETAQKAGSAVLQHPNIIILFSKFFCGIFQADAENRPGYFHHFRVSHC